MQIPPESPCITVQVKWAEVQSVFCACEKIQFFSVVFCVLTALHKLYFRLVINGTPNKYRPVERKSSSDILIFWHYQCVFFRLSLRILMDSAHAVQVNCILLNKDTGSFVQPETQNNLESRKHFQLSMTVQNKSFIFSLSLLSCSFHVWTLLFRKWNSLQWHVGSSGQKCLNFRRLMLLSC